ncbi:endonuclease/exonuclease/phosphatase family protein [Dyadobacter aurulentus]|uniref:endonuclease/exonuclease/phosphatase family protein n=1 Tax=Dyadobacter sp. UC 10 TaxID=2605428 RepID=UPI0011F2D35E|nr:endonuclease/exonuclease/phosphatase family protein [Dyadobacter sp. UC 10]KAA0988890.1 endonuclease/exonuclease/phosphatase family protein [Dyadobacter sp. UC 10]
MVGIEKFLWFLYKCFAFYTLLVYALILWIPLDGWVAGFMMMSFPVVIIIHAISVPVWYVIKKQKALLPLGLILLSGLFLDRTFAFKSSRGTSKQEVSDSFKVLSFNTQVFMRNVKEQEPGRKEQVREMKNWIAGQGDVLCMPEFYDEGKAMSKTADFFKKQGFTHSLRYGHSQNRWGQYIGLAVFSKYPIINSRDTIFEAQNGMIQADIKIGTDTVRIIALHLYSMTLDLGKLADQKKVDGVVKEGKVTFSRMKFGFRKRSQEIKALQNWAGDSPYPVIVCGDFNEIPYGYVYGKMRESYANAFEEKGSGFGFTFNNLPYFIRIDHQFYDSDRLQLLDFKTHSDIKYSDHYPISAIYQVRRAQD